MPMDGFESKTLNRKFDRIVFGLLGTGERRRRARSRGHGAPRSRNAGGPGRTSGRSTSKKAEGPDGKTVAELFAAKARSRARSVAVRGKVVKFTPSVMGKNWIHLRDGSGSREQKNDDITITTDDDGRRRRRRPRPRHGSRRHRLRRRLRVSGPDREREALEVSALRPRSPESAPGVGPGTSRPGRRLDRRGTLILLMNLRFFVPGFLTSAGISIRRRGGGRPRRPR